MWSESALHSIKHADLRLLKNRLGLLFPSPLAREGKMKGLFVTAIKKNEGCMSVLLITKLIIAQILAAKKKDPNTNTSTLEQELDKMVYGLTTEEIKIVEDRKCLIRNSL